MSNYQVWNHSIDDNLATTWDKHYCLENCLRKWINGHHGLHYGQWYDIIIIIIIIIKYLYISW